MTGKLFFFALLGVLVLVNVYGDDDFKEVEDVEEVENMEPQIEEDETSEQRKPRAFKFRGGFGRSRFGGGGGGWRRTGSSTSRGGFFRRTRSSGGGSTGFFRRTRSSGGGSTGSRIFRRTRTSGGSSGSRIFRRSRTSGGSSGSRIFRRSRTSGSRTSAGGNTNGGGTGTWGKIGTVLGIAQLGMDLATITMNTMGSVERKIVVSLGNLEGVDWQGGSVYMKQGSSIKVLPLEVATEEGVQMGGVKNGGPSPTGVSGALCYRFQLISKSFCLMFKVPYTGDNYWNVKVYDGAKQANEEIYDDLQGGATKAGNPVARKDIGEGEGYKIYMKDCSMTNSGQAVLQVYVGLSET